jgi:hypothetical protein
VEAFCDQKYAITSLTRLIENRKKGLETEFESLNYAAQAINKPIAYNDVVINEILTTRSANDTIYKEDWIELYNNTDDIIQLDGLWLSDDRKDAMKYAISKRSVIKPNGFVIVWADDKNKKNGLHANFKLSGGGEDVILFSEEYDTIDAISYGPQKEDSTYARFPNGIGDFKIMYPTFNSHNHIKVVVVNTPNIKINDEFVIFPNPASDKLLVKSIQNGTFKLNMYNSLGKKVFETTSYETQCEINVNTYSNGLYILKMYQNGRTYTGKVLIRN